MNNKGQSLVVFVLLIPVIFASIISLFNVGDLLVQKSKYESEIQSTIEYGLNHLEDENVKENMEKLLKENNIEGKININIEKDKIKINVKQGKINITYTGYKDKNTIVKE